eukprot:5427945-Heterocapsa_arctica.AAC.1
MPGTRRSGVPSVRFSSSRIQSFAGNTASNFHRGATSSSHWPTRLRQWRETPSAELRDPRRSILASSVLHLSSSVGGQPDAQ